MQRRDINAADAPAPAGRYTQAVQVSGVSRTLYISGQVGVAADGSILEGAEAHCALGMAELTGPTACRRHGDREPREDHHDHPESRRYPGSPR